MAAVQDPVERSAPARFALAVAFVVLVIAMFACSPKEQVSPDTGAQEFERLAAIAVRVEIIRDDFGLPHVYGKTDAAAVFGM